MNLNRAATEPFFQFYQFHVNVNRTVKITGAALSCVERLSAGENGERLLETLIEIAAPYWGDSHRYKNRDVLIENARVEVARAFTVRVFSAFERFLEASSALLSSEGQGGSPGTDENAQDANALNKASGDCLAILDPASRFIKQHKYDGAIAPELLTALRFFWTMRHCIVHADCRVGPGFYKQLCDSQIIASIISCAPKQKDRIDLMAHQSRESLTATVAPWCPIFLSDLCRRIASIIDKETVKRIGAAGLVRMASRLLETDLTKSSTVPYPQPKSFHLMMKHLLVTRYRAEAVSERGISSSIGDDPRTIDIKSRYNKECDKYLSQRREAIAEKRRKKLANPQAR